MYFDKPGTENTATVLELAKRRAAELGLSELVVATSSGETAYRALEICDGLKIVAVTYHAGFFKPFELLMTAATRSDLESKGARVVAASHAFSGIERGLNKKLPGAYPALLTAEILRLFGQGVKVAVEVAVMAADAGELSGSPIISVGGSGKGADAALVLTPANQNNFLDLRIHEIVCKPNLFEQAK